MTSIEILIYVLLIGIVPSTAYILIRSMLVAYVCALALGSIILISRIIFLESQAKNCEFDAIFLVSSVIWLCALAFGYLVLFLLFYIARRITKGRTK